LPRLGNVRELRNALEHAAILARGGPILPEHFPTQAPAPGGGSPADQLAASIRLWLSQKLKETPGQAPANLYGDLLHAMEPTLLQEVIHAVQGNRWVAAQWLGLNRATVRKKLTLYGLADLFKDDEADDKEG